ncbi:MAG: patatin-like phospholipase family protein [Pseudomonadota bacterium]
MSQRSVSLVLGSGGARGHAHLGVIRAIEERGLDVQAVAGTSMGAVIGGIYAADQLGKYTEWANALSATDIVRLLDFSFSGSALFKGDKVFDVLRSLLGDRRIEALDRTYTAVATDIDAHREIWLNEGSLFDAMRASAAVPGVFSPVSINDRHLVDGGLVNPIPIAPTLNDATDLTIAVDLNARTGRHKPVVEPATRANDDSEATRGYRERIGRYLSDLFDNDDSGSTPSAVRLLSDSIDIMQAAVSRLKFAAYSPDIVIDIPRDACSFFDFHRTQEMADLGYQRAHEALRRAKL